MDGQRGSRGAVATASVTDVAHEVMDRGFAHVPGHWQKFRDARRYALSVTAAAARIDPLGEGMPVLQVVGEFSVPPPGGSQRPFQALHIDFGLPLGGEVPVDTARFTALFRDARDGGGGGGATTRLLSLRRLLAHQTWPARAVIAERLGRMASSERAVEGVLGRIIEAAQEGRRLVAFDTPGQLCGMEFDSLEEERSFFTTSGLPLTEVEEAISLRPGELLVIDNLRTAHGRAGLRSVHELHQLFVGYRSLCAAEQRLLLDRVLAVFDG